jgi:uncharacterized cupredoxin-like copper-binding protein
MKRFTWPFLLVLLTLLLAGCGASDEVTIKAAGMRFIKEEVHVKAGQSVTLQIVNTDGYAHAFDIDEFDIHAPLTANERKSFIFTPTEPGRYRFYCGSPGHEAAGMVGVLVVEP